MKVFLDTNVLMDYLCCRESFFGDASFIIGLCEEKKVDAVISSLTVINCLYIARKFYSKEALAEKLKWMLDLFEISTIDRKTIRCAADAGTRDFEDAVQFFSAKRENVAVIISRDEKGFLDFDLPTFTPHEFIQKCKE